MASPILDYRGKYDGAQIDEAVRRALLINDPEHIPTNVYVSVDEENWILKISLGDAEQNIFADAEVDLPLESMVVNAEYSNGNVILKLQNGNETEPIPISALINGLVNESRTIAELDLKDDITIKELRDKLDVYTTASIDQLISDLENTINSRLDSIDADVDKLQADVEQNKTDISSTKNDVAVNKATLGMQITKNVFDLNSWEKSLITPTRGQVEAVENGIKFTHDNSNTATAYTNPYLDSNAKTHKIPVEPNTEYILSWETNTVNSGFIRVYFNGQSAYYEDVTNAGNINSKKFKTSSVTRYLSLQLRIDITGESTTFTNIMVRKANTDDTYEPYKPSVNERLVEVEESVSELTPKAEQNKSDILLVKSDLRVHGATLGYRLNNLIEFDVKTTTISNVKFTVNPDGTIMVNSDGVTNTTNANLWIHGIMQKGKHIEQGSYVLSGAPVGSTYETYRIAAGLRTDGESTSNRTMYNDYGNGVIITVDNDTSYIDICIIVKEYIKLDNVTFYPVLRKSTDKPSLQEQINDLVERIQALETALTQTTTVSE